MGVPSGGGEDVGRARGSIEIDTSQAEQAVPVMAGVGAAIEKTMKGADAATRQLEEDLKRATAEAQKAVVQERGRQQRLTETHHRQQQIRIATEKAVQQQRVDDNRLTNAAILKDLDNTSKRQIADAKIVAQQQIKAAELSSRAQISAANNVAKQQTVAAQLTNKTVIANSNNATKVQIANINQVTAAQNAQARSTLAAQQFQQRQILQQQAFASRAALQQQGGGRMGNLLGMLGLGGLAGKLAAGGAITFGIQMVVQGAQQVTKAAADTERLATAYERQALAARQLAGGIGNLDKLMDAYTEATGGAVDEVTALADVTRLQAIGFAESADELEEFVRASRGISIAMGKDMAEITQEVALAIANQSTRRLDQIGLGVEEVNKRIDELRESNRGLTREMAFQQAVLEIATEKYGGLTELADAQASKVEKLTASWKNLGLELAQLVKGPVDAIAGAVTKAVDAAIAQLDRWEKARQEHSISGEVEGGLHGNTDIPGARLIRDSAMRERESILAAREAGEVVYDFEERMTRLNEVILAAEKTLRQFNAEYDLKFGEVDPGPYAGGPRGIDYGVPKDRTLAFDPEQWQVLFDLEQERAAMEEGIAKQILDETTQYGEQRAKVIADYEQQIARGAEDFARQRQKAEADHQRAMAEVVADGLKRQQEMAEDLAKAIAKANRDSADRVAEIEEDYSRRVADLRADSADDIEELQEDQAEDELEAREESAEKLKELDEEYYRDRERAARDYNDTITSAAANLDAQAIWEAQKRFNSEEQEAAESHKRKVEEEKEKLEESIQEIRDNYAERIKEEGESLQKAIDQATEMRDEQIEDEGKALAKRNEDARIAHAEQLGEAIEADAQRLQDMKDAHFLEQQEADTDYGIRLGRLQQDHTDQLTEMGNQHTKRMTQIGEQANAERIAFDKAYTDRLEDAEIFNTAWMLEQAAAEEESLRLFKKLFVGINELLGQEVVKIPDALTPIADAYRTQLQNLRNETLAKLDRAQTPEEISRLDALLKWIDGVLASTAIIESQSFGGPSGNFLPGTPPPVGRISGMAGAMGGMVVNLEAGAIVIHPAPGQSPAAVGDEFERRLLGVLQKVAEGSR